MSFNNTTIVKGANSTLATLSTQVVEVIMEPAWLAIVRLTVESIIAFAGVVGNFLVCFVITRHRALNTASTYIYIRNVAIGDLATLLVSFPLGIVREQFTYWPLGEFTCRYIFPLSDIFFGVSVWSIAAIAVDRHRIVATNVPRLAFKSLAMPRIICAVIWLISFSAISLPLVLVFEYQQQPNSKPRCYAVWPETELPFIYSIAVTVFTYLIPLFLIFGMYCAIKHKLHKSRSFPLSIVNHSLHGTFKCRKLSPVKRRIKIINRIMTPVIVVFAITVLPLNIFRVASLFYFENPVFEKYSYVLFRISFFFYLFNSACNPLIYSIVSKRFQQSFREMLSWA